MIETFLLVDLRRVREAIQEAQQREQKRQRADQARARARATDEVRTRRRQNQADGPAADSGGTPAPPERTPDDGVAWWHVQPAVTGGRDPQPAYLHRGDCTRYRAQGRMTFTRNEARLALTEMPDGAPAMQPCPHCRPDIGLL